MTKDRFKKQSKKVIAFVLKMVLALIFVSPLFIGFVFSFLPDDLLFGIPSLHEIMTNLTVNNYKWVFKYIPILRYLLNSFVVCAVIITSQVILSSFAAYAFAFFKFKGKNFIFSMILVSMMIPAEVTVIANFIQVQQWGLINTYAGLCVTSLIGGTAIFMMRQYYLTIPKDFKDASVLDGCSDMRFLFQIAIPLSVPIIASLAIYLFISSYNMYFWPMLIAQETKMQTIQLGMAQLVGLESEEYGNVLAGAMISIIIPVFAFILGQDHIVKGMTAGAIKG